MTQQTLSLIITTICTTLVALLHLRRRTPAKAAKAKRSPRPASKKRHKQRHAKAVKMLEPAIGAVTLPKHKRIRA